MGSLEIVEKHAGCRMQHQAQDNAACDAGNNCQQPVCEGSCTSLALATSMCLKKSPFLFSSPTDTLAAIFRGHIVGL
jgi:hypothetical protein